MGWLKERDSEEWILLAVGYYRNLGFFADAPHSPDREVVSRVINYHGEESWRDFIEGTGSRAEGDMFLLMADTSRVWFRDLECVYMGADAYKEVVQEWAAISRGSFAPQDVSETWLSEDGPVEVSFDFGGRHTYVHRDGRDDFINLDLLRMINGLLASQPYRLEAADNLGDCRFIVALSPQEKARIRQERGWSFCDSLSA